MGLGPEDEGQVGIIPLRHGDDNGVGIYQPAGLGDGPGKGELLSRAEELGLSHRIQFPGWLESHELNQLYQKCQVVVVPSVWAEPFCLVGIEAMAWGKPVIAFDVGGISDWLDDGNTGFLIERKQVSQMASKIERLLGDDELAKRQGKAGTRAIREVFAKETHLARYISICEELTA